MIKEKKYLYIERRSCEKPSEKLVISSIQSESVQIRVKKWSRTWMRARKISLQREREREEKKSSHELRQPRVLSPI